jgi:hypothetical protein
MRLLSLDDHWLNGLVTATSTGSVEPQGRQRDFRSAREG